METLATRLKKLRDAHGWSQPDLATKAKVSQSFIGALEAENQKTSSWLPELAHALGVDAYWLKTGKGDQSGGIQRLSDDEQLILAAFKLISPDLRESWLDAATKAVERDRAQRMNAA